MWLTIWIITGIAKAVFLLFGAIGWLIATGINKMREWK